MSKEIREFQAQLLSWKQIHELPGDWAPAQLLSLLAMMDVDDVSEADAFEMALLALQDREVDEAAELVLETVFGDDMRPGVRQALSHDLQDERPWEEFADITQQMGIFSTVVLLQQAFPRDFDKPDAVAAVISLETASGKGRAWLNDQDPDPALLLRILSPGMGDRAVLHRLFHDSLVRTSFPEADAILWQVSRRDSVAPVQEFTLISSHQWFDPLQGLDTWSAEAWPDAPDEDEE